MIYRANWGLLCTDHKLFMPQKLGQCIAVPKEWLDPERLWLSEVGQLHSGVGRDRIAQS